MCRPSASCRVPQADGQPLHQGQPAAVGGRAAVARSGLGQVQLQRARAAVGDGHRDLGLGHRHGQLELGAGVQHGVLAQLAGQQHRGVGQVTVGRASVGSGRASSSSSASCSIRRAATGGSGVRRQPDPPLELNGHGCSLHRRPVSRWHRSRSRHRSTTRLARGGRSGAPLCPTAGLRTGVTHARDSSGRPQGGPGVPPSRRCRRRPSRPTAASDAGATPCWPSWPRRCGRCGRAGSTSGCRAATAQAGEVVDQFNEVVALQERRNRDLLRISRVVGREGRTDRAARRGVLRRRLGRRARARSTR